jgi:glycine oxidase
MSPDAAPADVLIVGGGVIGCALAWELAGRGRRVTLLERAQAGQEASAAAAGLLSPQSDSRTPGPLLPLALESHRLYPGWTAEIEEETGQTVGYRRTGVLRCALDEREEEGLRGYLWQRDRGLEVEWWDAGALSLRSGSRLASRARAGVFFPQEGVVDPRRLTHALAAAGRRRGVELRTETAARRFWIEGGRCRGVETESGRLEAEHVVDAAGAWAGFDRELPFTVPVEPIRGQVIEIDLGAEAPRTVLHSEAVYLVPRAEGRVLVGSTLERVGFCKEVTAGALENLIDSATRLLPAVRGARFVTAWAGLRPATPDGLPILGDCGIEGLFFATGHYRNGILLAPITARVLADRLTGVAVRDLEPFSLSRFAPVGAGRQDQTPPAGVFG